MSKTELRTGDRDPSNPALYQHQTSLARLIRENIPCANTGQGHFRFAEIGVWRGDTSEFLLREFRNMSLVMVDPWRAYSPDLVARQSGSKIAELPQAEFDEAREFAELRTNFAAREPLAIPRREILRTHSMRACLAMSDGEFQGMFLDSDHSYPGVWAELVALWPKVAPGGVFCGHDYGHKRFTGVKAAVDEWAAVVGQRIQKYVGKLWWTVKP